MKYSLGIYNKFHNKQSCDKLKRSQTQLKLNTKGENRFPSIRKGSSRKGKSRRTRAYSEDNCMQKCQSHFPMMRGNYYNIFLNKNLVEQKTSIQEIHAYLKTQKKLSIQPSDDSQDIMNLILPKLTTECLKRQETITQLEDGWRKVQATEDGKLDVGLVGPNTLLAFGLIVAILKRLPELLRLNLYQQRIKKQKQRRKIQQQKKMVEMYNKHARENKNKLKI